MLRLDESAHRCVKGDDTTTRHQEKLTRHWSCYNTPKTKHGMENEIKDFPHLSARSRNKSITLQTKTRKTSVEEKEEALFIVKRKSFLLSSRPR